MSSPDRGAVVASLSVGVGEAALSSVMVSRGLKRRPERVDIGSRVMGSADLLSCKVRHRCHQM